MSSPSVTASPRIEVIDVLRGFTLLGIAIIHMVEQYYAGAIPESVQQASPAGIVDDIVQGISFIFIMGKFFMIFSFLFGLSFHIQLSKATAGNGFLLRFAWRLVILFVIGMLHHIHYRGDILTIYAMLGACLLLSHRLSDKALLVVGLVLVFNVPSFLIRFSEGLSGTANSFGPPDEETLWTYYNNAKTGTYFRTLELNLYAMKDKMEFQVMSGRIFITLGLFLLGLYAGRRKYFEHLETNLHFVRKLLGYSWKALVGLIAFALLFFGGAEVSGLKIPEFLQFSVGGLLFDLQNACFALFYVCGIILLFQKDRWRKRLMFVYEAGRMGLTTYLMQSAVGTLIFFNFGFGLLSELGATVCFILALILFAFQVLFSRFWLRNFNYGPFEWLWRSLTYLKIAPLRRNGEPEAFPLTS